MRCTDHRLVLVPLLWGDQLLPPSVVCRMVPLSPTAIIQEDREQLEALRDRTNPRQLRQEIYDAIDYIFSLPGAVPGITEDVYQTLSSRSGSGKGMLTFSFNRTVILE